MAESKEELKSLLMKEESEKVGLKLNIQKMKIMASSPITSWEIDGETVETVADFILGGSKITADDDCSHEIKRRLLLGRKVMTNLDSIFRSEEHTSELQSHNFMSHRWGKNGNSDRFYFLGSKITADDDCSHEIKRHLLLGRKVMTNLDNIFKSRDITLPTKVHLVKAMVFPVVMCG